MVSDRKLAANRANAQKSTGPRTRRGKDRVRRNATTHGFFCGDLVLPGEDENSLLQMREFLLECLGPITFAELLIFERIVSASWRLLRLQRSELNLHDEIESTFQKGRLRKANRIEKNYTGDDVAPTVARLRAQATTPVPASGTLAANFISKDGDFERMLVFEQRLDHIIHRGLRQLRQLRKDRKEIEGQPRSPFTARSLFLDYVKEMYEKYKPKRGHRNANAVKIQRNKPTAIFDATAVPGRICDDSTGAAENPPKATEATDSNG